MAFLQGAGNRLGELKSKVQGLRTKLQNPKLQGLGRAAGGAGRAMQGDMSGLRDVGAGLKAFRDWRTNGTPAGPPTSDIQGAPPPQANGFTPPPSPQLDINMGRPQRPYNPSPLGRGTGLMGGGYDF